LSSDLHLLLQRQITSIGLATAEPPSAAQWALLLERVSLAYAQSDLDRTMLEHALETGSSELRHLNDQLRQSSEKAIAKKTVELQASLVLARAVQESVAEGILVYQGDNVLSWNDRFAELWCIPAATLVEPTVSAFIGHVCSLVRFPEKLREIAAIDARSSEGIAVRDIELVDGRVFVRYAAPIVGVEGVEHGRIVCFRDVSDERRVFAQRAVVGERMASVGQLVASVAHEINNPLAYVKGNVEFVAGELRRRRSAGDVPLLEALDDSCIGVDRIAVIVRDLRALSRVDEEQRACVDIVTVLESALQMATNQIRHRARIVRHLGAVPTVMANEGRLAQVFLNLLVNASQAIAEGSVSQNEVSITTGTTATGLARIEIRDTGSGIAPECLERIFDPFFTTKPLGVGTGLGLSICKGIVEKLGGTVRVESRLGHGSCFVIELPPALVNAVFVVKADLETNVERSKLEILVVDDDPMVRRMLERMLHEHVVTSTASVDEGVAALAASEFDLVLCDVMMPDRTGADMHDEVLRRYPDLLARLVFMTGGAFTPALQSFVDQPSITRLDKPLFPCAVDDIVRRIVALGARIARAA
jgi:signal transduction histidine kinase/ActR/RegA family two-component response regulator